MQHDAIFSAESEPPSNGTHAKWLLGVVALALTTAAGWAVKDVREDAKEALRRTSELERRAERSDAHREETNRRLDDISRHMEIQDQKFDRMLFLLERRRAKDE